MTAPLEAANYLLLLLKYGENYHVECIQIDYNLVPTIEILPVSGY